MKQPIETIRLNQRAKEKLIYLKKETGIDQWNILCRWALSLSLSLKDEPKTLSEALDSSVEIQWKVFAGELSSIYISLIKQRFNHSNTTELGRYVLSHLHRGIERMEANLVS